MPEELLDVELAYGRRGLRVKLPAGRTTVVSPAHQRAAADEAATLRDALRRPVAGPPLREVVRPGQRVAVSVCDLTRPQPREAMLRALLDELAGIVTAGDLTVLIATGTHRGNTPAELAGMLGPELAARLRVINHDARDGTMLTWCGQHGAGVPVWLNRHWVDADVKITTGFVEPHFFAGFSGGPKLVAPGLAGLETTLTLHDAQRIGSDRATWAVCEGNPVHDDVRAIAAATGVDFAFDVVLNREQEIVAAFGGEVLAMHAAAREFVRAVAMCPVDGQFEVVVTTNSGFPLDQNLYQAVKGMSAAATVVRPGGLIICAAECADGWPDHGSFRAELAAEPSPERLLAAIAARPQTVPDQWQVQVLARVLRQARVGVHTAGLTDADLRSAHLQPVPDIAAAVTAELAAAGPEARVCVLPEGPQTIPFITTGEVR
ncbi:MAG: nickel-dependent lactate racemase [Actinobacteria bacterium]|nr:nickel-dependent lactate racemase [Actinomycetota bacterium]